MRVASRAARVTCPCCCLRPSGHRGLARTGALHASIPEIIDVKLENRYNMDKGGIIEGLGFNSLVLGSLEKKKALLKTPDSRS